jgi:hypothetical protein
MSDELVRLSGDLARADGEVRRLAADRVELHSLLGLWRGHATELETTRAMRARRSLVRVRSALERRAVAGPAYPCVIGGTGGSGTRAFARLAARAGLWIGEERNEFEDALPIEHFLEAWLVPYWQGGSAPPHTAPPGIDEALASALAQLEQGSGATCRARGWKSPRSLYLLPYLAQRFPNLRFLHVLRDGRDVALSSNQLQLGRYGEMLLSPAEQTLGEAERSILLWSSVNSWASAIGDRLGHAYLRVRLEDLCSRPVATSRAVLRFFDLRGSARLAAGVVEIPATLGRYRRADPSLVARLEALAGEALRRFGYLGPEPSSGPGLAVGAGSREAEGSFGT